MPRSRLTRRLSHRCADRMSKRHYLACHPNRFAHVPGRCCAFYCNNVSFFTLSSGAFGRPLPLRSDRSKQRAHRHLLRRHRRLRVMGTSHLQRVDLRTFGPLGRVSQRSLARRVRRVSRRLRSVSGRLVPRSPLKSIISLSRLR